MSDVLDELIQLNPENICPNLDQFEEHWLSQMMEHFNYAQVKIAPD